MNKRVLIHVAAALLGIITGAATAYYSRDPQLASAIGGASYLGAMALGMVDPTVGVETATVTKADLDAGLAIARDAHAQDMHALGSDIIPAIQAVQDVVSSLKPVLVPAAVPAAAS